MTDLSPPRGLRVSAADVDQALLETLRALTDEGAEVASGQGRGPSREILDFTVELTNLRDRIPLNPDASFDLTVAVARFVWMISGDDRLADIRFYEEAVTNFSDNQISVPGSNYGTRLFQPRPGLNQIEGVVGRLKEDLETRRAAAVVWAPEDALREGSEGQRTKDIPCAFGLMFHVRGGVLHTQLKMRSNNAHQLLPVNLFEFGLLAELVAAETGTTLGPLYNNAASMHVYEDTRTRWEAAARFEPTGAERRPMLAMPTEGALDQAYLLARKEAQLRHELHLIAYEEMAALYARCDGLDPWWTDFYRLLLSHALVKVGRYRTAVAVVEALDASLVARGLAHLERLRARATQEGAERLFETEDEIGGRVAEAVRESWDAGEREQALSALQAVLREIEQATEIPVHFDEYETLASEMVDQRPALAARFDEAEDPAARFGIERREVEQRLTRLRDRRRGL
jgi:thymidylate synthase